MTTWTPKAQQTETWTPRTIQAEGWTVEPQFPQRVFSPYVFSRRPVFDTGVTPGIWDIEAAP